jgi:vacuolar-type H+-ATPase subunit B/Vma2
VPQLQYNTVSGVNGPLVIVENVWHLHLLSHCLTLSLPVLRQAKGRGLGSYTMLTMDCGTGQIPAIQ